MNALADRTRFRLLLSLKNHELCVCQLVDFIGMADSTVSKHMSILKAAGLVESRKTGRWVHYRMVDRQAGRLQNEILEVVLRQLSEDPEFLDDAARLENLIKQAGANICDEDAESCSIASVLAGCKK
jgi:DNA-binding transcriptional ArsR family regulator